MKYIFDFDDVLFYTTKHRKEHLYSFFEKLGVLLREIEEYYIIARQQSFSVKKMLKHFSLEEELYEKAMEGSEKFANTELIDLVKKIGKENCLLVTYGEEEFQLDKIKRIGIGSLFSEITTLSIDDKKEIVEKICEKYKDETVLLIDDKIKHLENLDFAKCPNLKTIFYDEHGLEKLKMEIGV